MWPNIVKKRQAKPLPLRDPRKDRETRRNRVVRAGQGATPTPDWVGPLAVIFGIPLVALVVYACVTTYLWIPTLAVVVIIWWRHRRR